MKKLHALLLTFVLLLSVFIVPIYADAAEKTYGDFKYIVLKSGNIEITGPADGQLKKVVIPSKIKGRRVTSIGVVAFGMPADNSNIESVFIPDTVTKIGNSAFGCCQKLKKLTLGKNVKTIGDMAFGFCNKLASVTLPKKLTTLGADCFIGCAFKNINIPASVKTIKSSGNYAAFGACNKLANINVNKKNKKFSSKSGVLFTKDGKALVRYPVNKKGVYTVPSKVTSIKAFAFEGACCSEVKMGANVKTVGKNAFAYSKLKRVSLPSKLTVINEGLFLSCLSLKSVSIPKTVTKIKPLAFYYCSALKSVTFKKGLKKIDKQAFENCQALLSVKFPSTLTTIGADAFDGCASLGSDGKRIVIPESVRKYGDAFDRCDNVLSVEIHNKKQTDIPFNTNLKKDRIIKLYVPEDSYLYINKGDYEYLGYEFITI